MMMPYDIDLNAAQLGTGCETTDVVTPIVATDLGNEIKLEWTHPQKSGATLEIDNPNYNKCYIEFLVSTIDGKETWLASPNFCDCNSDVPAANGQTIY
jgi:hypothetical protein